MSARGSKSFQDIRSSKRTATSFGTLLAEPTVAVALPVAGCGAFDCLAWRSICLLRADRRSGFTFCWLRSFELLAAEPIVVVALTSRWLQRVFDLPKAELAVEVEIWGARSA